MLSIDSLQQIKPILQFFSELLGNLKFRNILKRGKHDTAVLLNHHQIIDINDIRLMDLDEAGVISLDMIGRSIFLQQQRQLVVQHHFPQFPVGVITEKTDVNGAQNAQVIDGCGYHKSMLAGRIHTRRG